METRTSADERRLRARRHLIRRTATFAITCAFLALVNLLASPSCWWVVWVAAGWGLDIALHAVRYLTDCDEAHDCR